ncbi:MAG: sugar nucleotide-binding protein [Isosphaeraceae bacterium]|nr:sugar nucleotide-binding protein [Isosphaeraceae bacterium]
MRVVLTGASGQLGAYLLETLVVAGFDVRAWSGHTQGSRDGVVFRAVDLTDADATALALAADEPDVVLHAAALSAAEAVRREPERARMVNVEATARFAQWCTERDRRIIFTSTDLVFDGSRPWWTEADAAAPLLEYGRTKRDAERAVLATPRGLVARISLLFGASRCGRPAFFDRAVAAFRAKEPQHFFADEYRTPLDYATAGDVLARLVESDAVGLLHVAGRERMSRYELMRRIAIALRLDEGTVLANRRDDVPMAEPRPADVSLDTSRLARRFPDLRRPTIEEALGSGRVTSP